MACDLGPSPRPKKTSLNLLMPRMITMMMITKKKKMIMVMRISVVMAMTIMMVMGMIITMMTAWMITVRSGKACCAGTFFPRFLCLTSLNKLAQTFKKSLAPPTFSPSLEIPRPCKPLPPGGFLDRKRHGPMSQGSQWVCQSYSDFCCLAGHIWIPV